MTTVNKITRGTKIAAMAFVMALIVAIIGVCGFYIAKTYAYWSEKTEDIVELEVPLDESYNPSLKHIIFQGIDDAGNFVAENDAASYAVVGYSGLVGEVSIPDTYKGKNVTCILAPTADGVRYALNNNLIITTLIIPSTVVKIGAGACSNMINLTKVTVEGNTGSLEMGSCAFAGCINLTLFENTRALTGDTSSAFNSTGL